MKSRISFALMIVQKWRSAFLRFDACPLLSVQKSFSNCINKRLMSPTDEPFGMFLTIIDPSKIQRNVSSLLSLMIPLELKSTTSEGSISGTLQPSFQKTSVNIFCPFPPPQIFISSLKCSYTSVIRKSRFCGDKLVILLDVFFKTISVRSFSILVTNFMLCLVNW